MQKKEAIEMLFLEHGLSSKKENFKHSLQTSTKREIKEKYYNKLPLFFRAFLYFFYRYFIRLGFLDGRMGFLYHFFHVFWYRMVVDLFIFRVKFLVNKKDAKIKNAIKKVLQIDA